MLSSLIKVYNNKSARILHTVAYVCVYVHMCMCICICFRWGQRNSNISGKRRDAESGRTLGKRETSTWHWLHHNDVSQACIVVRAAEREVPIYLFIPLSICLSIFLYVSAVCLSVFLSIGLSDSIRWHQMRARVTTEVWCEQQRTRAGGSKKIDRPRRSWCSPLADPARDICFVNSRDKFELFVSRKEPHTAHAQSRISYIWLLIANTCLLP